MRQDAALPAALADAPAGTRSRALWARTERYVAQQALHHAGQLFDYVGQPLELMANASQVVRSHLPSCRQSSMQPSHCMMLVHGRQV